MPDTKEDGFRVHLVFPENTLLTTEQIAYLVREAAMLEGGTYQFVWRVKGNNVTFGCASVHYADNILVSPTRDCSMFTPVTSYRAITLSAPPDFWGCVIVDRDCDEAKGVMSQQRFRDALRAAFVYAQSRGFPEHDVRELR